MVIRGRLLRRKKTLTVNYDGQRHESPGWQTQLQGMQNYVAMFEISDALRPGVMHLIQRFRFDLGIVAEPEIAKPDDPRLGVIQLLAIHMDAVIFTPGALLDAQFRPFAAVGGDTDPDAVIPAVCAEAPEVPQYFERSDSDDDENIESPTAARVARRMYVLLAIAGRGLLDMNLAAGREPAYDINDLRAWLSSLDIAEEVEPREQRIIETPAQQLAQQDLIDSIWTLEGLAVIAWALGLLDLPPYDRLVETDELLTALAFLDYSRSRDIITKAALRPVDDLERFNRQIFAYHWRMVDYRVNRTTIDFARVQFGPEPLDVSWALVNGDLALQGVEIVEAEPELFARMSSVAMERHKASNWLCGHARVYSETPIDT